MTEHPAHPYTEEVAPDPLRTGDFSLPALLRKLAAQGTTTVSRSMALLPDGDLEMDSPEWQLAWARYLSNFYQFSGDHNLYLALSELAKHSEQAAADVAERVLRSYDAGDSYGEWLWQWAEDQGLDPQRIVDEDKACPTCAKYVGDRRRW